jgi:hypothetical protein
MSAKVHINELFADSLYQEFNQDRYGLKGCKKRLDPDYAFEMKALYERGLERKDCNLTFDCCCSFEKLEEQINTL